MQNSTKKDRGVWLIGGTLENITGCKLPSNKQALGRFYHLHFNEHETIQHSARNTVKEIVEFWEKARIPTRQEYNIIIKLKELHSTWQNLHKNSKRNSAAQKMKEAAFTGSLDDLFDCAHADALALIKIPEDREFLLAQREKGRRGCLGPVDMKLAKQEERRREREDKMDYRKRKECSRLQAESTEPDDDSSNDEANVGGEESEEEYISLATPSTSSKVSKRSRPANIVTPELAARSRPASIVTPELAAALDRTKTSNRGCAFVLAAAIHSLGQDPKQFSINRETIRQSRRKHREDITADIRASFAPDVPLTVHWDGKLLPSLTSKDTVDRLAVIVSGEGVMKLLGVPMLPNGTGEAQAEATYEALIDWNLAECVKFMSFDTTASNSGLKSGACILLEQKLKKELFSLACRHHIHELIVGRVFDALMGPSSGPEIKIFKRFATAWNTINKDEYESAMSDERIIAELNPIKEKISQFIKDQLTNMQPRDDYKELLQLSQLFLGEESDKRVHINAPGACHRARWMAKLIYCLKIYLFRSQFYLTAREREGLCTFNVFIIRIYLKAWYTCPHPSSAPRNDLELLKELIIYKDVNATVANAALKSFTGHLWYLSEFLIGLALFDGEVKAETKVAMVAAMTMNAERADSLPLRRINISEASIPAKQLSDFVSMSSMKLLTALNVNLDFLSVNPSQWETNASYITAKARIDSLKVVNDAAERGVALIQSFNAILTNQEEQKQYLLQVVENHRRMYPNANKSTIALL